MAWLPGAGRGAGSFGVGATANAGRFLDRGDLERGVRLLHAHLILGGDQRCFISFAKICGRVGVIASRLRGIEILDRREVVSRDDNVAHFRPLRQEHRRAKGPRQDTLPAFLFLTAGDTAHHIGQGLVTAAADGRPDIGRWNRDRHLLAVFRGGRHHGGEVDIRGRGVCLMQIGRARINMGKVEVEPLQIGQHFEHAHLQRRGGRVTGQRQADAKEMNHEAQAHQRAPVGVGLLGVARRLRWSSRHTEIASRIAKNDSVGRGRSIPALGGGFHSQVGDLRAGHILETASRRRQQAIGDSDTRALLDGSEFPFYQQDPAIALCRVSVRRRAGGGGVGRKDLLADSRDAKK